MQIHYWDATWTLYNEIVFVIQPHVDMSKSQPAAGDFRMDLRIGRLLWAMAQPTKSAWSLRCRVAATFRSTEGSHFWEAHVRPILVDARRVLKDIGGP